MTAEDFRAWPEVVWHLDQPVSDPLAIAGFLIARRVAADGKIVMSGAGANELFGGSEFHAVMMWAEGWRRLVPGVVRSGLMLPGLKLTLFAVFGGAGPQWQAAVVSISEEL